MKIDDKKIMVTVLTPTYNRVRLLPRLYKSLIEQTSKNFQWIVVDDGSKDGTEDYFKLLHENEFEICYLKKENGGKHTALNYSHSYIKGEIVVIVDSDDYLLPNAIEIIVRDWPQFRDREDICGMSYLKGFADGTFLSLKSQEQFHVDDDYHYRVNNRKMTGDRCEMVRTDLFCKYPFPEFDGEKFISEDMLWNALAMNYKTVYCNEVLYICEYLEGGLTKTGRKLRLQCGNGMKTVTRTYLNSRVCLRRRIKATWLYICYAKCSGDKMVEIIKSSGQEFFTLTQIPFGFFLYEYWKRKYLK